VAPLPALAVRATVPPTREAMLPSVIVGASVSTVTRRARLVPVLPAASVTATRRS